MKKRQKKLLQMCYDKYNVRQYIREKLGEVKGEEILNTVYGVYNSVEEIDFEKLPDSFVLKITQSSGWNIICPDKSKLNIKEIKEQLKKWLFISRNIRGTFEESYVFDGKAKIVCERMLLDENGNIPTDIRIFCFHGEPKLIWCTRNMSELSKWEGAHGSEPMGNTYDLDWNLLNVDLMTYPHREDIEIPKPDNLEEILEISRKLSEDFLFTRVDLYNINNRITFGELTWVHNGGTGRIVPDRYDEIFGSWIDIEQYLHYVR